LEWIEINGVVDPSPISTPTVHLHTYTCSCAQVGDNVEDDGADY
jgi:hypothetical protein